MDYHSCQEGQGTKQIQIHSQRSQKNKLTSSAQEQRQVESRMLRTPNRAMLLDPYIKAEIFLELSPQGWFEAPIASMSMGMKANADFFSHPKWGPKYFKLENHRNLIGERWRYATGNWNDMIVVDLGCGPGNLFRCIDGLPKLLLGIDISEGALHHALKLGYTGLRADLHNLPLISECADLVTANAVLHHVDCMETVLKEAARLVKPGGLLVTDEDPLMYEHNPGCIQKVISKARTLIPIARVRQHPDHSWKIYSLAEQARRRKTELHFQYPGDGVCKEMYREVLEPMGFEVSLYSHGHIAGEDIFVGGKGSMSSCPKFKQRLAGKETEASDAMLSLMCVAKRREN